MGNVVSYSNRSTLGGPALRPIVDRTQELTSVDQFLYGLEDGPLMAGDMIFTIGLSFSSQLAIWGAWSKFSHVMMADRDPSDPEMPCFFWESVSHTDEMVDVHTGSIVKSGVRLVSAKERLETSARKDGQKCIIVGLVRLHMPPERGPQETTRLAFYKALSKIEAKEYPKAYERSKSNLAALQYSKLLGENVRDNSEYFCSELMAETYRQLSVIRVDTNSSMIGPKQLAEHKNGIVCINNFTIGPELYIYRLIIPPVVDNNDATNL